MITPNIALEQSLWSQGFINVAGIDEAGRGPLAGPLTAAALVIHSEKQVIPQVRDSKIMTSKQRENAFTQICKTSTAYSIASVSNEEIDKYGIHKATQLAMLNALEQIEKNFQIKVDYCIVDGSNTMPLGKNYQSQRIKSGDLYHYSISAASVLAKVTRDRLMHEYSKQYPQYGFDQHVGYGTKLHLEKLKKFGPCPIHRRCFEPIKSMVIV